MAVLTAAQALQLARTHYRLADELRDRGRLGEAIANLHAAVQLCPDFAEAHCELANALLLRITRHLAAAAAPEYTGLLLDPRLTQ
jgi:tetratricopeptide (TPR) repeat protein